MFNIKWWDNGQTSLSNRIFKQLNIFIGRLEFGWHQPFEPYAYIHDRWATTCCGGMDNGCIHEDAAYEMYLDMDKLQI